MAATRVRLAIADDRSADSLCGFVESAVIPGARIVTDDWNAYGGLRARGFDHHAERGDPEVAEEFLPIVQLQQPEELAAPTMAQSISKPISTSSRSASTAGSTPSTPSAPCSESRERRRPSPSYIPAHGSTLH